MMTTPGQAPDELLNTAISLHQSGHLDAAKTLYQQVLASQPRQAIALYMLGTLCLQQGLLEQGITLLEESVAVAPAQPTALSNLGYALNQLGRHDEALSVCTQALMYAPGYDEALNNQANAFNGLKRHDEAITSYRSAIAANPNHFQAYYNLGNTYKELKRYAEAQESYKSSMQLRPDIPEAHNNMGITFQDMNRCQEAIACYDRAIALRPDYIDAHWNKALMKLMLGEFTEGWPLYEWGWRGDAPFRGTPRRYIQPLWLGDQPLAGKTLLLHAEQGLGDTIQFCRYALLAKAQGAQIIIQAPAPLVPLLNTLDNDITVITNGQALPPFDLHCPLMSLPLAFKTEVTNIHAPTSYLAALPEYQKKWQARLGQATKPRIGLVWSGSNKDQNDHNRSLLLNMLEPLLNLPAEFHCLQKEIREIDRIALSAWPQVQVHAHEISNFADTAALVSAMDMVISVDTSVAHLAGALGKPVWILLPYAPDFRWMLQRSDSPWYPTAKLFRQPGLDDWESLLQQLQRELQTALLTKMQGHQLELL